MKQFDFESSNYKHKEEVKTFIQTFNDMAEKFVRAYDNREQDLKRVNSNIEKKNSTIERLEVSIMDLTNKTEELKSLKELSNAEIEKLNRQKSEISYTDSEVQKMEIDDINSQIAQKRSKIQKIDSKIDSTKAKIRTNSEEKKTHEKELKALEREKKVEEEALYRTNALLDLVNDTRDNLNTKITDIVTSAYRPHVEEEEPKALEPVMDRVTLEEIPESEESESESEGVIPSFEESAPVEEVTPEPEEEPVVETPEPVEEVKEEKPEKHEDSNGSLLEDILKRENIDLASFSDEVRGKLQENSETAIKNISILKKHNIPLEFVADQAEILYDISSQDLDDLLSIITTDDEGNGMGFSIDFTFNILNELSKINVDRLIDVYNSEFMNVNSKSGIIYLLKLTNPGLVDFEKNRRANVALLRKLGTTNAEAIIEKYPDFINMDNPLFANVLNTFDRSDLVEKLNADVDVIPKILEYWKNN